MILRTAGAHEAGAHVCLHICVSLCVCMCMHVFTLIFLFSEVQKKKDAFGLDPHLTLGGLLAQPPQHCKKYPSHLFESYNPVYLTLPFPYDMLQDVILVLFQDINSLALFIKPGQSTFREVYLTH